MDRQKTEITADDGCHPMGTCNLCPHCDIARERCRKYDIPRQGGLINEIGNWTWENYCLHGGGCDRFFSV